MIPLKLRQNRVWRLYYGGKMIDKMRGAEGPDGNFPEDWLASVVRADNPPREGKPENEGLSVIDGAGEGVPLADYISADPERALGREHCEKLGGNFGVLAKFLDSAERLPVQCHPSKEKAKLLFDSDYGKTESWYILGGRTVDGEEPHIYMGFKKAVDKPGLKALFDRQDIGAMLSLLNKIYVKPGDVYLIEGGMPHAIGAGCFLLETQEPTDYTISLEKTDLRGKLMPDHLCHMGLGFDRMFDCFDYTTCSEEEIKKRFKLESATVDESAGGRLDRLIDYTATESFALDRLTVTGAYDVSPSGRARTIAVTRGSGVMTDGREEQAVRGGDCLFEPACCGSYKITSTGSEPLEVLFCLPPKI